MAIEKVVQPYEFLARWREGVLTGGHVQFITRLIEDGVPMEGGERLSDAMPVDVGDGKGFPLAEILQQIHVDALIAVDTANADKSAAQNDAVVAREEKEVARAAETTAKAETAAVAAELTAERARHGTTQALLKEAREAPPS